MVDVQEERSRERASRPSEDEIKNLISKSQDIKSKAYAPYSHFKVGAALLTDNGTVFTGDCLMVVTDLVVSHTVWGPLVRVGTVLNHYSFRVVCYVRRHVLDIQ